VISNNVSPAQLVPCFSMATVTLHVHLLPPIRISIYAATVSDKTASYATATASARSVFPLSTHTLQGVSVRVQAATR